MSTDRKAEIDAALTPKPLTPYTERLKLAILGSEAFLAKPHESPKEKRQRFQAAARRERFGRKVDGG